MVWVSGVLGGALMGMVFVAHLSVMFALRPPAVIRDRSPESTLVPLVTAMSVLSLLTWLGLGVGAAVAFDAARTKVSVSVPGMPSVVYTAAVVGVALVLAPPLLLLVRRRVAHVVAELVLFAAIFGWLVPALVTAR